MKVTELKSLEDCVELIQWHNTRSTYVVLDIETTGLDPFTDKITDICLSGKSSIESSIFPAKFLSSLELLKRPLVAHNFKFDFNFLLKAGIDLRQQGLYADTLLLDHLLDENQPHSLDEIVKRRYNDPYKEIFWSQYKKYEDAPREAQVHYAGKDVIYTGLVYKDLVSDLISKEIPKTLIQHVHDLALALYSTELSGIKLDLEYLHKMERELQHKIYALQHSMRADADLDCTIIENNEYIKELDKRKTDKGKQGVKRPTFNFDSQKQLCSLLYDKLDLEPQFNKNRKRTVDDAALDRIEQQHALIPKIRSYRGYQKVYTAFIEGSLKKMRGGRIYPSFNVNGTVTGRLSSSSPNMQQLPTDGGVRGIYVPEDGFSYISCDYSQLEVTLAAHFSRDKNLLRIVYEGASQHDITAEGLQIPRQIAKTINFALQYGAGAKKIQTILGCSFQDAELALNKYWETYSGLRDFIRQCHSKVEKGIPLVNPFGRQRNFPKEFETHWDLERAKRQAANSLIQGTGADVTNKAYYGVHSTLTTLSYGRALFPIHDEILIEVKDEHIEHSRALLEDAMLEVGKEINLTVPLSTQCGKGMKRWSK